MRRWYSLFGSGAFGLEGGLPGKTSPVVIYAFVVLLSGIAANIPVAPRVLSSAVSGRRKGQEAERPWRMRDAR